MQRSTSDGVLLYCKAVSASTTTEASCLNPDSIHTQFQVLPGKLPFRVVLKVLEVYVDVIIVIGSDRLDHLELGLILRFLLETQTRIASFPCVFVCICVCVDVLCIPSFWQSAWALRWLRSTPATEWSCPLSAPSSCCCHHSNHLKMMKVSFYWQSSKTTRFNWMIL